MSKASNSNVDDFEKRRSQAAIRAQALKELEKERQNEDQIQKLKDTYGEKPLVELEAPMIGGESNVILYRCPLVGDQVMPKEEMRQAIRDFLFSQVAEEPGLTSCLIIHTLNKDTEKVFHQKLGCDFKRLKFPDFVPFQLQICVETLCKYLDNILQNPTEEKFRKIRKSNKAYQERIACMEGTDLFLQSAGFATESQDSQEFWVFPPEADIDQLHLLKEALLGSEPVRAELDRATKVLLPSQAQKPISLPPDFFNLTPEELKREQKLK